MVKFLQNKKFVCITACLMLTLALGSLCFAASGDDHTAGLSYAPIVEAVTGAISPLDIIKIIAMTITAGMGFVLAWFGIRKVLKALKSAIFRGSLRG